MCCAEGLRLSSFSALRSDVKKIIKVDSESEVNALVVQTLSFPYHSREGSYAERFKPRRLARKGSSTRNTSCHHHMAAFLQFQFLMVFLSIPFFSRFVEVHTQVCSISITRRSFFSLFNKKLLQSCWLLTALFNWRFFHMCLLLRGNF